MGGLILDEMVKDEKLCFCGFFSKTSVSNEVDALKLQFGHLIGL